MTKASNNTFAGLGSRPDTPDVRARHEEQQKQIVDGRTLRRRNRAEQVAFKTSVEVKLLIQELTLKRGTTITEVMETAVRRLAAEEGL